jgi:hypothetical protein
MIFDEIGCSGGMSAISRIAPLFGSTSTVASLSSEMHIIGNISPLQNRRVGALDISFFVPHDPWVIVGRTLIEKAYLNAFAYEWKGTSVPQAICLHWPKEDPIWSPPRPLTPKALTAAQRFIEDIREKSKLTLEEITPLAGVSRRSLQHWRAGGVISARKENRLRDLADTFRALPQDHAAPVRRLLFERTSHGVRPYDLLAEGRFAAAYSAITGQDAPAHIKTISSAATIPPVAPLLARLSIRDSGPVGATGGVDLRRSRRLKR